jgi:hypothetical protein
MLLNTTNRRPAPTTRLAPMRSDSGPQPNCPTAYSRLYPKTILARSMLLAAEIKAGVGDPGYREDPALSGRQTHQDSSSIVLRPTQYQRLAEDCLSTRQQISAPQAALGPIVHRFICRFLLVASCLAISVCMRICILFTIAASVKCRNVQWVKRRRIRR